jgi:hypothetical protein
MVSFDPTRSKRLVVLSLSAVLFFTPQVAKVAFAADPITIADGVLQDAIGKTLGMMQSMSQGCSGGANGVPPVNWGPLQVQGNAALNAFQNARVALAKSDTATAVLQINTGESGLDNLVNGAHNNCSGGCCGVDPVSYGAYQTTRATVETALNTAKLFLQ